MKLAFDAKKLVRNRTGIGNYSRRVVWSLQPHHEITGMELFAPRSGNPELISSLPSKTHLVTPPCILLGIPGFELWRATRSASVANRHNVDIYHGLSNELPADIRLFTGKKVVTIHDLIFLRLPHTYPASMRRILEKKTRFACDVADKIIAVSQRTRTDLIELYDVDPERIEVIYQSIDPIFFDRDNNAESAKSDVQSPYILCVGTIERRKNQKVLIEALSMLPPELNLVIIGKPTPYQDELLATVAKLGLTGRVKILNNIPTSELPFWYSNALVTCNPSHYEGFGIPVAESIASGTPVIVATGSCLEEAAGPGGICAKADDPHCWAEAISSIATDSTLRTRLATDGLVYATNFSDVTMGNQMIKLYKTLLQ